MDLKGPILVAEDDSNDALLFQCALAKTSLKGHVFFVADGSEAKRYLAGEDPYKDRTRYPLPSVLIVDLVMPRVTGMELLEWVRQQPELHDLFVVVLTGMDKRSSMERAYQLGANLYMVKPLQYSELAGLIACAAVASTLPSATNLVAA